MTRFSLLNLEHQGTRLKKCREALNLSQKDLSEKLGVTQAYWSNLEKGKRDISKSIIDNLIHKFDVSPEWLFLGLGTPLISEKKTSPSENQNTSESLTLLQLDQFTKLHPLITTYIDLKLIQNALRTGELKEPTNQEIIELAELYFAFKLELEEAAKSGREVPKKRIDELRDTFTDVHHHYIFKVQWTSREVLNELKNGLKKKYITITERKDSAPFSDAIPSLDALYQKWVAVHEE